MTATALPTAAQRLVDAINNADTDAFVAAFADDGYVDDLGRQLHGPAGVRSWVESDAIGAGAEMTVLSAEAEGDTVRIRFAWRSRVFNGESDGIFVLDGDRIASFTIPPSH